MRNRLRIWWRRLSTEERFGYIFSALGVALLIVALIILCCAWPN